MLRANIESQNKKSDVISTSPLRNPTPKSSPLPASIFGRLAIVSTKCIDIVKRTEHYSFRDLEKISELFKSISTKIGEVPMEIIDTVFKTNPPENSDDTINWKRVRGVLGDSLEIERRVNEIIRNRK